MNRYCILGGGALGTQVAALLEEAGAAYRVIDADPSRCAHEEIEGPYAATFVCIPTAFVTDALDKLPLESHGTITFLNKGVIPETGKFAFEWLRDRNPALPFAVLAGPMLADDMEKGGHGFATIAGDGADELVALFGPTRLHCAKGKSAEATATLAALKNAYALLLGFAEGIDLGENACGMVAAGCTREMVLAVGETDALGTAGMGDFFATALSASSKNHETGIALAEKKTPLGLDKTEGMHAANCLDVRYNRANLEYPLLRMAAMAAANPEEAERALKAYAYAAL